MHIDKREARRAIAKPREKRRKFPRDKARRRSFREGLKNTTNEPARPVSS